jgi:hypothetical protein
LFFFSFFILHFLASIATSVLLFLARLRLRFFRFGYVPRWVPALGFGLVQISPALDFFAAQFPSRGEIFVRQQVLRQERPRVVRPAIRLVCVAGFSPSASFGAESSTLLWFFFAAQDFAADGVSFAGYWLWLPPPVLCVDFTLSVSYFLHCCLVAAALLVFTKVFSEIFVR